MRPSFSYRAGRDLAHWHLNCDTVAIHPGALVDSGNTPAAQLRPEDYRVVKMKFAKSRDPETNRTVPGKTTGSRGQSYIARDQPQVIPCLSIRLAPRGSLSVSRAPSPPPPVRYPPPASASQPLPAPILPSPRSPTCPYSVRRGRERSGALRFPHLKGRTIGRETVSEIEFRTLFPSTTPPPTAPRDHRTPLTVPPHFTRLPPSPQSRPGGTAESNPAPSFLRLRAPVPEPLHPPARHRAAPGMRSSRGFRVHRPEDLGRPARRGRGGDLAENPLASPPTAR